MRPGHRSVTSIWNDKSASTSMSYDISKQLTTSHCIVYYSSTNTRLLTSLIQISPVTKMTKSRIRYRYAGRRIAWSTHKQSTVARLLKHGSRNTWLYPMQQEKSLQESNSFLIYTSHPITMLSDSQSAIDISENLAKYRQAKHLDIRYHAIRHYIHEHTINVDYIPFGNAWSAALSIPPLPVP